MILWSRSKYFFQSAKEDPVPPRPTKCLPVNLTYWATDPLTLVTLVVGGPPSHVKHNPAKTGDRQLWPIPASSSCFWDRQALEFHYWSWPSMTIKEKIVTARILWYLCFCIWGRSAVVPPFVIWNLLILKKEESGWISDKTNSPHLAYIYLQSQHSAALIITAKTYKKLPLALQSLDPFLGGIKGGTEGSEK